MEFDFEVPITPFGKQRPRFSVMNIKVKNDKKGKFKKSKKGNIKSIAKVYTPKKTHDLEDLIRYYARSAYKYQSPTSEPVFIKVIAYYPIAKSTSKKRAKLMLENKIIPDKKPDADNILKLVLDALNPKIYRNKVSKKYEVARKGIYEDDKQVYKIEFEKKYREKEGLYIYVKTL